MHCLRLTTGILAVVLLACPVMAQEKERVLGNITDRILCHQQMRIVAFGSSSTYGYGASSPDKSYPARLPFDLLHFLPDQPIPLVINAGVNGDTTAMNNRRMQRDVIDQHPDLVVWTLGVNEAFDGTLVEDFHTAAVDGIKALLENHIDVVLMDPQDTPNFRKSGHAAEYAQAVRDIGRELRVPVIRRFDLMKAWFRNLGPKIFFKDNFHLSDIGYEMLARETADFIVKHADLPKPLPEKLSAAQQARCDAMIQKTIQTRLQTH